MDQLKDKLSQLQRQDQWFRGPEGFLVPTPPRPLAPLRRVEASPHPPGRTTGSRPSPQPPKSRAGLELNLTPQLNWEERVRKALGRVEIPPTPQEGNLPNVRVQASVPDILDDLLGATHVGKGSTVCTLPIVPSAETSMEGRWKVSNPSDSSRSAQRQAPFQKCLPQPVRVQICRPPLPTLQKIAPACDRGQRNCSRTREWPGFQGYSRVLAYHRRLVARLQAAQEEQARILQECHYGLLRVEQRRVVEELDPLGPPPPSDAPLQVTQKEELSSSSGRRPSEVSYLEAARGEDWPPPPEAGEAVINSILQESPLPTSTAASTQPPDTLVRESQFDQEDLAKQLGLDPGL